MLRMSELIEVDVKGRKPGVVHKWRHVISGLGLNTSMVKPAEKSE